MIRRPPRSTLDRSSAASDVYKRQGKSADDMDIAEIEITQLLRQRHRIAKGKDNDFTAVSYTHLRAHETVLDLVCRLLLEKKKNTTYQYSISRYSTNPDPQTHQIEMRKLPH